MAGEPVWNGRDDMVELVKEPLACASGDGFDEGFGNHQGNEGPDSRVNGYVEVGHRVTSESEATLIPFAPGLPCFVLTGNNSTFFFRLEAQGTT